MAYEAERFRGAAAHTLTLEERERLCITGVEEVESFDENTIVMVTVAGTLVVRGSGLHIEQLSLEGGQLQVEGQVESLNYEEDRGSRGGLLARLFG
ncbi:MAG: sporulation protein YabP [Ruminococcaceae bacterium]|nr:sporulation protein YabP [Oscillospiraceae bacterium]